MIIEENKGELSRSWRVTQRVFGDVKLRDLNAGNVGVDVPLEQITNVISGLETIVTDEGQE